MFINFTNHPSDRWSEEQIKAAKEYGEIVDVPFPNVPVEYDAKEVCELAERKVSEILELIDKKENTAILCQGEFTLSYVAIQMLSKKGIKVVSAISERIVKEIQIDGTTQKISEFKFRGFREYTDIK